MSLAAPSAVAPLPAAAPPPGRTAIRVGRLFDGDEVRQGPHTIVVSGGLIESVRPGHDDVEGATVEDLRDATALPGLIDAHAHLGMRGDGTAPDVGSDHPSGFLTAISAGSAQQALRGGITTVRDTGSSGVSGFDLKNAADHLVLPHLIVCGAPITITGGHCWFLGGEADGVDGVRARVRQHVRDGADWIKVMATGGGTKNTYPWLPSFTQAEMDAIVDEAHRRERKVTVHCLSAVGMAMAIEAGADQIEHGGFSVDSSGVGRFDERIAERLAAADIAVTPTLSVRKYTMDHHVRNDDGSAATAAEIERWQVRLDAGLEQFAGLVRAGVRYVAGTDAGWHHSPFDALPVELALMTRCGVTPVEALRSATGGSASHFDRAGTIGTLAAGASADVLVVDGDPTTDLDALVDVRLVLSQGRTIRRAA